MLGYDQQNFDTFMEGPEEYDLEELQSFVAPTLTNQPFDATTLKSLNGIKSINNAERADLDKNSAKDFLTFCMNSISHSCYLQDQREKVRSILDSAFAHKLSVSKIFLDTNGLLLQVLRDILTSYNQSTHSQPDNIKTIDNTQYTRNYVAYIDCALIDSDSDAFGELANQFLIRTNSNKGKTEKLRYDTAQDALHSYFTDCRVERLLAVVVLRNFEALVDHSRQSLLYTLLDYMHKKELLFMVIGITAQADVPYLLEKRNRSRIDARYHYLAVPSPEMIARDMYYRLVIPLSACRNIPGRVSRKFRIEFNKTVALLFGTYSDTHQHISDRRIGAEVCEVNKKSLEPGTYDERGMAVQSENGERKRKHGGLSPVKSAKSPRGRSNSSSSVLSPTAAVQDFDVIDNSTPARQGMATRRSPAGRAPIDWTTASSAGNSQSELAAAISLSQQEQLTNKTAGCVVEDYIPVSQRTTESSQQTASSATTGEEAADEMNFIGTPPSVRTTRSGVSSAQKSANPSSTTPVSEKRKALPPVKMTRSMKAAINSTTTSSSINNSISTAEQEEAEMRSMDEHMRAMVSSGLHQHQRLPQVRDELAESRAGNRDTELLRHGSLIDIIETYCDWGMQYKYFYDVMVRVVSTLDAQSPYLSTAHFVKTMTDMEPISVSEKMCVMCECQLYLLAALAYLHLHKGETVKYFTVAQLLTEFDKMTNAIKDMHFVKLSVLENLFRLCEADFISLHNHQSGHHSVLSTGVRTITNQTIVYLKTPLSYVQSAFLKRHKENVIGPVSVGRRKANDGIVRVSQHVSSLLRNPQMVNNGRLGMDGKVPGQIWIK